MSEIVQISNQDLNNRLAKTNEVQWIELKSDYVLGNTGHREIIFRNCVFENFFVASYDLVTLRFSSCQFESLSIELHGSENKFVLSDCIVVNEFKIKTLNINIPEQILQNEGINLIVIGQETKISSAQIETQFNSIFFGNGAIKQIRIIGGYSGRAITFDGTISKVIEVEVDNIDEISLKKLKDVDLTIRKIEDVKRVFCFESVNCKILFIYIKQADFIHVNNTNCTYVFYEVNILNFLLNDLLIDRMTFSLGISIDKLKYSSTKIRCNSIDFDGATVSEHKLPFERFELNRFSIIKTEIKGGLELFNCSVAETIKFELSSLGSTTINGLSITPSLNFVLTDSNIDNVRFANVRWLNDYKLADNKNLYSHREAYRLLKANYLKSNNKIEALEFQRYELETHFQIVTNEKKANNNWRSCGNYWILWTHLKVSDFGLNVWKPFCLLVGIHFVLFLILMLSQEKLDYQFSFNCHEWTLGAFIEGIGDYLYTLSPVHTAKIGSKQVPIQPIVDFFMRIFSGYFLFYFISATRKYHQ